jgi:hypothetical protein
LIFGLFLIFSIRLFNNYQSQIRKFLNNTYKQPIENTDLNINHINTNLKGDIMNEFNSEIDFSNNDSLLTLITYYNPSATSSLNISKSNINRQEIIFKIISRLYYENQNYFSRVAILSFVFNLDFFNKFIFLKDNINITPLKLRIYLLESIASDSTLLPESHHFFTVELIIRIVSWI